MSHRPILPHGHGVLHRTAERPGLLPSIDRGESAAMATMWCHVTDRVTGAGRPSSSATPPVLVFNL
jgi:hypothetical protein